MGYVSYSEGFNPGGLVHQQAGHERAVPDHRTAETSELRVGMRSDLADGRVRLNATLFDTSWDNTIATLAMRFCDASAATAKTRGPLSRRTSGSARNRRRARDDLAATDKLLFNVNLGFLDTGYDEITVPTGPAAGYVAGQTEFSQAPENTYNLGVQYDATFESGGSLTTRFDYSYVSQYWRAADPTLRVAWYAAGRIPPGFSDESGDFGTFNARLTYAPAAGNWDLALFGTNLTDEYQLNSGFFHGIWGYDFATVGRPREFGSSLTFRF